MAKVWKAEEWQDAAGFWHCNDVSNIGGGSAEWYIPARILGISPAEFIKLLVNTYHPEKISYDKDKCFIFYAWKNQNNMRIFKNFINAQARKVNFQI